MPEYCLSIKRLVALLAIASLGLPFLAPATPVRAEPLGAPLSGQVAGWEWASFPVPVKAGLLYDFTLTPYDGDADLYLYREAVQIEYSITSGTNVDHVQWRADQDGEVVAWVYGLGEGTTFELVANTVRESNGMRVGLQVGHWRNWEAGPPLSRNSGASGGGKTEAEVNIAIARETAALLEQMGYAVDILPTAIPRGYAADAVVAIHADGGPSNRRGFFSDTPAKSPVAGAEARLSNLIDQEYATATGLTRVYRSTVNTKRYYGYSRVTAKTPMVIVETGFLTNAADREIIVGRPDLAARGLANGIDSFLSD